MQHNVQPLCGARRPGWERPGPGRHRLPCILPAGHTGTHQDALRQTWDGPFPTPQVNDCDALDGQCTGETCGHRGDPREPVHRGLEHGMRVSFVDEPLMPFELVQWDNDRPEILFVADGTWPTLNLAQTDELLSAVDEYAGALRVAREHLARSLASVDALPDADLMRVDAPQVNEDERVHTIRLLDAPGATLTVTCPDWCVSDHADEKTRGTFAPDFTHHGEELVFPAPGGGEPMLSARITHAPFSSILREPVMGVWSASEDMGPDQVHEFADRLRAYADALDCLSVDLDDARLNARDAHEGDR